MHSVQAAPRQSVQIRDAVADEGDALRAGSAEAKKKNSSYGSAYQDALRAGSAEAKLGYANKHKKVL